MLLSRARPVPVRPTVDRASPPPRAYLASLVHMRLAGPVFGELVSAAGCQTRRILLRRPRSVALKGPGLRASLQRSGPDRAPFFFWAGDFYPSGREGCQPPVGFFGCLRPPATRRIFKVGAWVDVACGADTESLREVGCCWRWPWLFAAGDIGKVSIVNTKNIA